MKMAAKYISINRWLLKGSSSPWKDKFLDSAKEVSLEDWLSKDWHKVVASLGLSGCFKWGSTESVQ